VELRAILCLGSAVSWFFTNIEISTCRQVRYI
jgi:hypothetical protein